MSRLENAYRQKQDEIVVEKVSDEAGDLESNKSIAAIFKTGKGERGTGNGRIGEWGLGNGESLKAGIFKMGNL